MLALNSEGNSKVTWTLHCVIDDQEDWWVPGEDPLSPALIWQQKNKNLIFRLLLKLEAYWLDILKGKRAEPVNVEVYIEIQSSLNAFFSSEERIML